MGMEKQPGWAAGKVLGALVIAGFLYCGTNVAVDSGIALEANHELSAAPAAGAVHEQLMSDEEHALQDKERAVLGGIALLCAAGAYKMFAAD